jgi:plastocyanin domain-containing protein
VPVRWEITDTGTSSCTNAVISKSLFDGQISLTPGQTSTKEFTPQKVGRYKFSCWMGMVTGTIDVVDAKSTEDPQSKYDETKGTSSGGSGCGCCSGKIIN